MLHSRFVRPLRGGARFARTPKGLLSGVFAILLAVAGSFAGWSQVGAHVLAAVLGAVLLEAGLTFLVRRPVGWPTSALLSGTIVAFVLGPETAWPVTVAVGALATASKHVLRTARGHVFNPAALALAASIPLFATGQSWWGAGGDLAWPCLVLVLGGGALIVDRLNKFPLVLTFGGLYFGLFTLAALVAPERVAEMFRPPFIQAASFLAMFMLTDPPTSPGRFSEQVWVGGLAATAAVAGQLVGLGQAYLLLGVLSGNAALALRRLRRNERWASNWQRRPETPYPPTSGWTSGERGRQPAAATRARGASSAARRRCC